MRSVRIARELKDKSRSQIELQYLNQELLGLIPDVACLLDYVNHAKRTEVQSTPFKGQEEIRILLGTGLYHTGICQDDLERKSSAYLESHFKQLMITIDGATYLIVHDAVGCHAVKTGEIRHATYTQVRPLLMS